MHMSYNYIWLFPWHVHDMSCGDVCRDFGGFNCGLHEGLDLYHSDDIPWDNDVDHVLTIYPIVQGRTAGFF